MAWTNDWHHWLWTGFSLVETGNNALIFHHGIGFVWEALCGYSMILVTLATLWRTIYSGTAIVRQQARSLFLISLLPLFTNLTYLLAIPGTEGVDWSPIFFSAAMAGFWATVYGRGFLRIAPIARETLIESMTDGVFVLDPENILVDYNLAAQRIFGVEYHHLRKSIDLLSQNWPAIAVLESASENVPEHNIIETTQGVFDVRLTYLKDKQRQIIGKLIVFRNITALRQSEQSLAKRLAEIQALHADLQHSQAQLRMVLNPFLL